MFVCVKCRPSLSITDTVIKPYLVSMGVYIYLNSSCTLISWLNCVFIVGAITAVAAAIIYSLARIHQSI